MLLVTYAAFLCVFCRLMEYFSTPGHREDEGRLARQQNLNNSPQSHQDCCVNSSESESRGLVCSLHSAPEFNTQAKWDLLHKRSTTDVEVVLVDEESRSKCIEHHMRLKRIFGGLSLLNPETFSFQTISFNPIRLHQTPHAPGYQFPFHVPDSVSPRSWFHSLGKLPISQC